MSKENPRQLEDFGFWRFIQVVYIIIASFTIVNASIMPSYNDAMDFNGEISWGAFSFFVIARVIIFGAVFYLFYVLLRRLARYIATGK